MTRRVNFSDLCTFTDKQWEATRLSQLYTYFLYGGSRGPGKSHWVRWYDIRRLMKWAAQGHKGVHVGLFCEDYPSLRDRQISKLTKFPEWLGSVQSTQDYGLGFYLAPEYGSGIILLRNLDDATKYQSTEFAGISIDELTKNPFQTFDDLRGSLRWPGISDPFFAAATNPNGRFFKWVRSLWIEGDFTGPYEHLAQIAGRFKYLRALPADNPYLDQSYWDTLNSLPDRLRAAWRDGDWYTAVEGLVFDSFTELNITDEEPDPEAPFELGIDDGYIDPRATLFIQKRGATVLVFDELYQTKRLEEETVRDITERCNDRYGGRLPSIAAVSHEAVGLQRRLREANIPARNWMAVRAPGRDGTRAQAIQATRALVCDGKGHRGLLVHKRCKNLIDEITTGYRNKPDPAGGYQDEPEDGNDHAAEALEGWVWLRTRR